MVPVQQACSYNTCAVAYQESPGGVPPGHWHISSLCVSLACLPGAPTQRPWPAWAPPGLHCHHHPLCYALSLLVSLIALCRCQLLWASLARCWRH